MSDKPAIAHSRDVLHEIGARLKHARDAKR
jgi:hypothetical protein